MLVLREELAQLNFYQSWQGDMFINTNVSEKCGGMFIHSNVSKEVRGYVLAMIVVKCGDIFIWSNGREELW